MGTAAHFDRPHGLVLAPNARTLYVSDFGNRRIREVDVMSGRVSTVAGVHIMTHADGVGTDA